jgi:aspartate/methionine/tyrosine aminotransferase
VTHSFKNLTGYEIDTLPHSYNLTDGHAFRSWSPREAEIISRSGELFLETTRRMQSTVEREFIKDFLRLGRQTFDEKEVGYLMCFGASMAFEIVANHLRMKRHSLALIEPAFDNLADIFARHEVPMRPVPEWVLEASGTDFECQLGAISENAVCLVSPNNPTGRVLSEENLLRLAAFCRATGALLILDNCFRAYLPRDQVYDQYRILLDSGAAFICVEDTGKTWPTCEIKAPFFAISRTGGLFQQIYDIYTDFLLHVSPVGIRLVHEFIRLSLEDDLESIRRVVRVNREALYGALAGSGLTPCERPFASVAWLRIEHSMTGLELKEILDRHGVFVLAGDHFYWSDRKAGEKFIRVALTRDADMFAEAACLLGQVCSEVNSTVSVLG